MQSRDLLVAAGGLPQRAPPPLPRALNRLVRGMDVSPHKVEQRRLTHRGRVFHFVAYEGVPANERRGQPRVPPMWHLMNEGKRRPVMEHLLGQELSELDAALLRWVEQKVYGDEVTSG